jgi:predicted RNA-binding Zn-ribbon protein involved in translation (DUF1610 family)
MSLKNLQLNLEQIRPWLTFVIVIWLLASFGLGWLVNSLLIIFAFLLFVPVVMFIGLRWWIQKNMVVGQCPVCDYNVTGLDNNQLQCSNCGEHLVIQNRQIRRFAPEGTIDITAVEVQAQSLDD